MISTNESMPRRIGIGLSGLSVLYSQFNEISFFVEDAEQEQLYFAIFSKLFPGIRLSKIFPLGGKPAVMRKAKAYSHKKKAVFIVDKDFDDVRNIQENLPNLFYLKQYSIENYLLEQAAIDGFVVEERPRMKAKTVRQRFTLKPFILGKVNELVDLFTLFMVAQEIGYVNCKLPPERFAASACKSNVDMLKINAYRLELENQFTNPAEYSSLLISLGNRAFGSSTNRNMRHICGKYLCFFTKNRICAEFRLKFPDNDSFCFRLAKGCQFKSLAFLQNAVNRYVNS
jgi:hypothetical protein